MTILLLHDPDLTKRYIVPDSSDCALIQERLLLPWTQTAKRQLSNGTESSLNCRLRFPPDPEFSSYPFPFSPAGWSNGERRSTGIGKTIVEFCSIPISDSVDR
jgi:hypothetical protein